MKDLKTQEAGASLHNKYLELWGLLVPMCYVHLMFLFSHCISYPMDVLYENTRVKKALKVVSQIGIAFDLSKLTKLCT